MPSIKINYQPEVFDNEHVCEDGETESCNFMFDNMCVLFGRLKLYHSDKLPIYEKDEKCKKYWQQASESRPPKTLPEGHRLG